jgi:hypothetical protein
MHVLELHHVGIYPVRKTVDFGPAPIAKLYTFDGLSSSAGTGRLDRSSSQHQTSEIWLKAEP